MLLVSSVMRSQETSSVDILDYDLALDFSTPGSCLGDATLTLTPLQSVSTLALLLEGTVDSMWLDGVYLPEAQLNAIPMASASVGDTLRLRIRYSLSGYVEQGDFGGLHFDRDMDYNLGVGFYTNPHSLGRVLFPCRDNFTDKSTYTLRIRARQGWTAQSSGVLQSRSFDEDGCELTVWRIAHPVPTYLVGVGVANWDILTDTIYSHHGTYPLTLGHHGYDSLLVRQAFAQLDSVVPMFERCFGPYRWERIGYIGTRKGSMEHVNNIALVRSFMGSMQENAQTTIAHELGHAWFGNLVTCSEGADMWINEGGASFTAEVAMEAVNGRTVSDDYYQRNLKAVIQSTHLTDGGYRPLSPMPHAYTYGSTTYNKGWMVWHSLRGYLGEENFYNAMNLLMERCAFGNINAYRLRDSLSLYSGIDLTDFFDFHVFSPGFVDYYVGLEHSDGTNNEVCLWVCQQTVGGSATLRSHRIPITFFSHTLDTAKRLIVYEGNEGRVTFSLPFEPAFWILDYDKEISDAAIVAEAHLAGGGMMQNLRTASISLKSVQPVDAYVEHHWGTAYGDFPYGTIRPALRYWLVRGTWDTTAAVQGRFQFARGSDAIDQGFYTHAATYDSLAILYRPGNGHSWRPLPHTRNGNANEGTLVVDSLLPGEYTLAVVDTVQLSIPTRTAATLDLFPNPLPQDGELTVDTPLDTPYTISIFASDGRLAWRKTHCTNGQKVRPRLTSGTYFVVIENNFISLHSKLIQL